MSQSNSVGLIGLQIMWNRLIAVVEEQAQTLMRTAFSPIVRECGDLSAGVFDLDDCAVAFDALRLEGALDEGYEMIEAMGAAPGAKWGDLTTAIEIPITCAESSSSAVSSAAASAAILAIDSEPFRRPLSPTPRWS